MTRGDASARSAVGGSTRRPLLAVGDLRVIAATPAGPRTLVRDVTFDLGGGQTVGIVGESGGGKTMTARAIMGVLPPGVCATGDIHFDGRPVLGVKERALRPLRGSRISMVLQDPFTSLNPLQTIREHLHESLRPATRRNRATARAEVERRLTEVGLDPAQIAFRYPFQLSGGMRQRVAIAAALASDPELLIADEPTTALDVATQAEVLDLLTSLQRDRGMALVLITHDLRVAFSVCDRVLVMYAGSVIEDAPAAELAGRPEHPYTLGLLLAEPPVTHRVERLVAIPGSVPAADEVAGSCPFAPRCSWREKRCTSARPALQPVSASRRSACLRVAEIRDEIAAQRRALADVATPAEPSRSSPLLAVADLQKTYHTAALVGRSRTIHAARGVSFEIGEGESLGLVGETGSGKTTIARCILGLTTPTSGTIHLGDLDLSDYRRLRRNRRRAAARQVQVVFQDPYASLNPMFTIGAALREAVSVGDSGDPRAEVANLLRRVGLPESYAGRRPSALSGGERQRAAIARAIAVRPRLLICDEPVAALDVSVQAQILELLRDIRRTQQASMLFMTHDLSVVRQMADRTIVLWQGQIVESGPTARVLDAPQHPYTTRLLHSIPAERPQRRTGTPMRA